MEVFIFDLMTQQQIINGEISKPIANRNFIYDFVFCKIFVNASAAASLKTESESELDSLTKSWLSIEP